MAIIGLLAAIAVPNFVNARNSSRQSTCINNLRQISAAKDQWALENNQAETASPGAADLDPYIRGAVATEVFCPLDTAKAFASSYTVAAVNADPTCLKDPGGSYAHVL